MGFATRLTSATALASPSAAVRVFEAPDNSNQGSAGPINYGVLAFSDGMQANGSPDADASIARRAVLTPSSQTSSRSGGLLIASGSYGGVTGPELDLNVEYPGDGSRPAIARLKNAGQFDLAGAKLTSVGGVDDSGWITQSALGSGYTIGTDGSHYRKVAGLVFFQMDARGTATGLITNYPAGFRPSLTIPFIGEWGNAVAAELKLTSDGNLTAAIRSASAGFIVSGCFPAG